MLDFGVNRINTKIIFWKHGTNYCEPNISFCVNVTYVITLFYAWYRHILKKSCRYALDVFKKYGIRTLCHW